MIKIINKPKNKIQEDIPKINTLEVLLQSLKYQLRDLKSVNMNIENLKPELNGGSYQEKKKERKETDPV